MSTASSARASRLSQQAAQLRRLHVPGQPLVLPNAWDASSARRIVEAGFPAIATASSAIADVLGLEDGDRMPPDDAFAAIRRISRSVDVPVSADVEGGYGLEGEDLAQRLLDAGAVGCNLEDTDHWGGGLIDSARQVGRIAAIRAAGHQAGVEIVINARVDVHLREVGDPGDRLAEALRRGRLYREAGADCLYPIMVTEESVIAAFVEAFDGMVNVYARPEAPSLARLRELGVARVSYGPWIHRLAMRRVDEILGRLERGIDPYDPPGS
jgi:2-methylisocitrate lyase-like PEP mutase family enzyme